MQSDYYLNNTSTYLSEALMGVGGATSEVGHLSQSQGMFSALTRVSYKWLGYCHV